MIRILTIIFSLVLAGCITQPAPESSDVEMIRRAMSEARESLTRDAANISLDETGRMKTLRRGTNRWSCFPHDSSPGLNSMCVDTNGLEWVKAWLAHKPPPANKMGLGYMLMDGSDVSQKEYDWMDGGPHVIVFNMGNRFEGYPATQDDIKTPFVMWPNTPYAHLMIPIK